MARTRTMYVWLATLLFSQQCFARPAGSGLQAPLKVQGQRATLELQNQHGSFATTKIAFGNPPQVFEAIVDIGASDTFVPDSACGRHVLHCQSHAVYNASSSQTYVYDGRFVAVDRNDRYTVGTLAQDSIHMGDIEVKGQVFEQASAVERRLGSGLLHYDTVLGLSREPVQIGSSSLRTASSLQLMMEQSSLEHNIFALRLPEDGVPGRLTLGWVDESLIKDKAVARLPLVNSSSASPQHYPSGGWLVEATSLSLEWRGHEVVFQALPKYNAIFSTAEPFSRFPAEFVHSIQDLLGAESDGTVNCARVQNAPELVVSLPGTGASMHRLIVKPQDYIRSEPQRPGIVPGRCYIPITPFKQSRDDHRRSITLGYLFLRRYYSVFDADARMISLATL